MIFTRGKWVQVLSLFSLFCSFTSLIQKNVNRIIVFCIVHVTMVIRLTENLCILCFLSIKYTSSM